jgi:hypothetical protein
MKWAQYVTSMRYKMYTEFWLKDKIHIGLVKVITTTLQVVKYAYIAVFYFSIRMYFVILKGKCSL